MLVPYSLVINTWSKKILRVRVGMAAFVIIQKTWDSFLDNWHQN